MRKLIVVLSIAVLGLVSASYASNVRGAKGKKIVNFSASAALACSGPATVYSVFAGTATAAITDYIVLRDSNTANTTSTPSFYIVATSTAEKQVTLDPPLIFQNGVSINGPATMPFFGVSCEAGYATGGE